MRTVLVADDVALDLLRALRPVIAQLRRYSPRPQIRSSAQPAASCSTSPRGRRRGRDPRRFRDMAHGSAGEIRGRSIGQWALTRRSDPGRCPGVRGPPETPSRH